ncbi:nucleolar complex protein [Xylaria bambusicola]|uniref:nucleolar complex protein n=1 Tax=Xylaria bambusicola TaxID=326684 RepID=UPI002008A88C|nr:nucleolar complex protein [Xylaria bambusicola]KAI0508591.1 nucleolar complex protein [Xylaria bambusicola]
MPSVADKTSLKRKRAKASEKASKRTKPEVSDEEDEAEDRQAEILQLEEEIAQSKKNYNNITTLLEFVSNQEDDLDVALFAAVSLCRVFLRLLASGSLSRKPGQSDREGVVIQWLKGRLSDYKKLLIAALSEEATASTALTISMRLLKAETHITSERGEATFPKVFLRDIVGALVRKRCEDVQEEFCEKYLGEYADVRFYTFEALTEILANCSNPPIEKDLFSSVFDMLSYFDEAPSSAEDLGSLYIDLPKKKSQIILSLYQQKKQCQSAWVALLRLNPDRQQRKQLLEIMAESIAPWFVEPALLMDFLTDSYNAGGSLSLLALSGVFFLIQNRNLDYPSFYPKLYSLLDADILHSKHRSRFLRLLDTFLASTHLPAMLVASFIKKLARLCLNAPPSAIVAIIPWIYNLLKKHPLCTFMIHRVPRTPESKAAIESEGFKDPFNEEEMDPMQTQAIDSCLWEVVQLQSHYHPNVATIATIISEQFTKQLYNMEDFLDHSYQSLVDAELSKSVKKPPAIEFMIPKRVFLPNEPASGFEDNLLVKLWEFE